MGAGNTALVVDVANTCRTAQVYGRDLDAAETEVGVE